MEGRSRHLAVAKRARRNDDHWAVRRAAVQELARGWKDDPDTLPWLKTAPRGMTNSSRKHSRIYAIR